ncbi:MAG TPA: hypothetical protein VFO76_11500 [Candidatus Kapabacteria bacterium]|nr:hypothetical protein [Candidatus Kapabacteria bacterium]
MKYLIAVLLFLSVSSASAQLFPSRSFMPSFTFRDPTDITSSTKYLTQQGMWGNLSRGFESEGQRFAWDISFGGFFELVQWKKSNISFVGDFEVLADIYNNISFNPRAIYWTEGFLYSLNLAQDSVGIGQDLAFGYTHRCRHDIDNIDYNTVGSGEERTLIYGSLNARYLIRNIPAELFPNMRLHLGFQLDQYLIRQDDRLPKPDPLKPLPQQYDIDSLNTSLSMNLKADLAKWDSTILYVREHAILSAYNAYSTITLNLREELGLEFSGAGTRMNIFAGIEGFDRDDYNRPIPTPSNFFYVGFRFIGKNVGL